MRVQYKDATNKIIIMSSIRVFVAFGLHWLRV